MAKTLVANDCITFSTTAVANTQEEITIPDRAFRLTIRPTTNQIRLAFSGGVDGSTTVFSDFHICQANILDRVPVYGYSKVWVQSQVASTQISIICEMDRNP